MDRCFAMALSTSLVVPDPEAIISAICEIQPTANINLNVPKQQDPRKALSLVLFDRPLAIMFMDAPLPAGTLDQATTRCWNWPDARTTLDPHRAHIIIADCASTAERSEKVAAASNVSLVGAAISKLTPSLAIYWTCSEAVHKPDVFYQRTKDAITQGRCPLELWTRVHFGKKSAAQPSSVGCFTTGLSFLIGRELEFAATTVDMSFLFTRVLSTATCLLDDKDGKIKDGDTIGIDAEERIRIKARSRGEYFAGPVWGLSLESGPSMAKGSTVERLKNLGNRLFHRGKGF